LKEKYDLLDALKENKQKIFSLETQRQNLMSDLEKEKNRVQGLLQENAGLSEKLRSNEAKTAKLKKGIGLAVVKIKKLNLWNSILGAENIALREEGENLRIQLNQANQENNSLKGKLSLGDRLRRAIRDSSTKKRNNRVIEGNRGFLVKDGKPTGISTVKIEVSPAQGK